jgi:succinate dehydrogenase/fumarate reductase cytochrome b subunit (b558 family)
MNLPKIHSITKKICVALLGGFLLIFLLFHACANLCILRHDDGAWYSAFCHFMGTNYVVKVFEIVLLATILLHIAFTVWLWVTNRMARPVRYHKRSKSTTHTTSKLMMWTGILIFACLILHFTDFYFVKLGWVEGQYMVKVEDVHNEEVDALQQAAMQYGLSPEEFIKTNEEQLEMYQGQLSAEQMDEIKAELDKLRAAVPAASLLARAAEEEMYSADRKWIRHLNKDDKDVLETAIEGLDVEPDFYYMAREKFKSPWIVFCYLVFFVIVWMHMRHAFPSAFQTLGLNNYKYSNIIEILGQIYAWVVCLMFAAVVILVFLGL